LATKNFTFAIALPMVRKTLSRSTSLPALVFGAVFPKKKNALGAS
jgi:hypothetical protein